MAVTIAPNYGLYFDKTKLDVPTRAVTAGQNFRVANGKLNNLNIGWTRFSEDWQLNGPVMVIDNFFPRDIDEQLIFVTTRDIYIYDANADTVRFLTPIYSDGTASASGTAVTGAGTLWAANVVAGNEISFGDDAENDPEATWYVIASVGGDTSLTLETSAGTVGSGDYTIRRTFNGTRQNQWAVETWIGGATAEDLWFATNGLDPVVTWNGTDPTVTLHPELGFRATTLATYSNMMIYGNILDTSTGTLYNTSIINSDVGLPLNAGATGTGLSEQFRVHDGSDDVMNTMALADYLVIYSERHIVLMQFVGDPLVFVFRSAIEGVGPIAYNAIADFGDFHEFLGSDTQYSFDGVVVSEINGQLWRDILRQMDPLRRALAFAHFDEERGDLIWSVPLTGDAEAGELDGQAETAYTEHYLEDAGENVDTPHSHRRFPFTATGFFERSIGLTWQNAEGVWADYNYAWNDQFFALGFPQNLAGDKDGYIYIINESQYEADGTRLPSFVRFGRRATYDGRRRDLLTRVYPFVQFANNPLDVRVFMSDFGGKNAVAAGLYPFDQTQPEGGHFVSVFRAGRFFEVQFGTTGEPWILEGWDYDTRKGGSR